ncbi:MAG: AsmA family protein, partial [Planctomycetota bacterium]|nr:AsmA family protein [Planctomycetota bacterium]
MIKRLLKVLLGLVLGVVLLVGALFIPGVANLLGLSGFVTQQVERLADDFLNPRLTIGSITYVFPRGAILYDVTLTQDDTTILHIKRAKIALERLPISSQQVRFSGFYLEDPVLRLQVDDQGDLIGWSDFVKEEPGDASDRADRASDHFAVDRIVMTNATIEYADQRVES